MGIEAIGNIGPALASFGEAMKAPLGNIVNEGPVGGGFVEGFRPMNVTDITTINTGGAAAPLGEILFKPQSEPTVIQQAESVAVAAWEKSKLSVPEPKEVLLMPAREVIMPQVEPMAVPFVAPNIWEYPIPAVAVSPALAPAIGTQAKTETRSFTQSTQAVASQPALQEQEEIVEEKVLIKQDQKDKAEVEEGEDFSESRIKIVEAEKVSNERRKKIRKAVKKAQEEDITVAQALPEGFWDDKSPLVGNGKDWTLDLTAQALEINPNDYQSLEEAEEASIVSVAENIPVKEGEGGRQATIGEVRKVTNGEKNMSKPEIPAEIVVRRSIKKRIELAKSGQTLTVLDNKAETTPETTLKDLNLEEVFPKAV
ncbi:hypothetical protein HYU94_01200 [Candidatus Daviesbacteria bacterium]|nr:hypothetical protein [Candidatus Daviesbacteria bacterium]